MCSRDLVTEALSKGNHESQPNIGESGFRFRSARAIKKILPEVPRRWLRNHLLSTILKEIFDENDKTEVPLVIAYDLGQSSPGYGDYCGVLVMARLLELSGVPVLVKLENVAEPREDWDGLTPANRAQRIQEFMTISSWFVGNPEGKKGDGARSLTGKLRKLEGTGPRELYKIAGELVWKIPSTVGSFRWDVPSVIGTVQSSTPTKKKVCINYRRGAWDSHRDMDFFQALHDLRFLIKKFVDHEFVLCGESNGTEAQLLSALRAGLEQSDVSSYRFSLRWQSGAGMMSAIEEVKEASFYFQRMGGGLGMFAAALGVPHCVVLENPVWWPIFEDKVFPWSDGNHRFLVQKDAKIAKIETLF